MTRSELLERINATAVGTHVQRQELLAQLVADIEADGVLDVQAPPDIAEHMNLPHIAIDAVGDEVGTPTMTVTISTGDDAWSHREAISDELPPNDLGRILRTQIERFRQHDIDPTEMKINIVFGRV